MTIVTKRSVDLLSVANCLTTDTVGDFVYITGDKVNNTIQVSIVDITNISKMPAIGLITSKITSTKCTIQKTGVATGVYSGLTPQSLFFIGPDGRLTETSPTPPTATTYYIQLVGIVLASDQIELDLSKFLIKQEG